MFQNNHHGPNLAKMGADWYLVGEFFAHIARSMAGSSHPAVLIVMNAYGSNASLQRDIYFFRFDVPIFGRSSLGRILSAPNRIFVNVRSYITCSSGKVLR
jgi:hypothetical protein